jgi:hypothetical protein
MTTVVDHTSGPRNRWVLPLLLALIIVAIILGAIFIPKLTKSSASPTATSQVVVVTGQATAGVVTAVVTATTTGALGTGSTPLPGASPVPTQPGLTLGMITHPMRDVTAAQAGVDRKDPAFMFRLDPRQVVMQTLPKEGFSNFTIVEPVASPSPTPHVGVDHRMVIRFVVSYQGKEFTVAVAQPGRQGATGVWFIVTVLKGRHLS